MSGSVKKLQIWISSDFSDDVPSALLRFRALNPSFEADEKEEGVLISSNTPFDRYAAESEFFNLLYKEKIYRETLPIRIKIIG